LHSNTLHTDTRARAGHSHKPSKLALPNTYRAWLETLVLTCACFIPLSAWILLFSPAENSLLFWACLAPLVIAAFHGTAFGLASLAATIIFLAGGMPLIEASFTTQGAELAHGNHHYKFPLPSWSGIALWIFAVGECRRYWQRRALAAEIALDRASQRIKRFSRNYRLLKHSHEKLSQTVSQPTSHIRGAVRQLKTQAAKTPPPRLRHLGKSLLNIFCDFGALQCAGLYTYHPANNGDKLTLSHSLGLDHQLDQSDPMLTRALESGAVQYVGDQFRSDKSRYQLCIPFVDCTGKTHAVIAAESIQFFALNTEHVMLLDVLAQICADLLNEEQVTSVLEEHDGHVFKQKIKAYRTKARQTFLNVCVVTLQTKAAHQDHLLRELVGVFRDTDTLWFHQQPGREDNARVIRPALSVLMPMTDSQEAQAAIKRVEAILKSQNHNIAVYLHINKIKTL